MVVIREGKLPKLYEGKGGLRRRERGETINIPFGKEKLYFFHEKRRDCQILKGDFCSTPSLV